MSYILHTNRHKIRDPGVFHVHELLTVTLSSSENSFLNFPGIFCGDINKNVFLSWHFTMTLCQVSATNLLILLPPMSGWGGSQQQCLGPWWWQRNSWGSSELYNYKRSSKYSSVTDPAQRHAKACSLVNGHRRGQHPHAWNVSVSQQGTYDDSEWKVTNCAAILMNFFMSWTLLQSVGHNSTSVTTHSWTSLQRCSSSSSATVWPPLLWRLKVK